MTNERTLGPADERLLDAALAQVFAGKARGRVPATARWPRWVAAALVLLGVSVTTAVWWMAPVGRIDETQEPAPLPPEVTGAGRSELEALPATTANLFAKLIDPLDLPVVARFERLRCLRLWAEKIHLAGINTGRYHSRWGNPPADLLAPVAKLQQLETLHLPRDLAVTPALLAPLAGHATLRKLQFVGDGITIDDPFAAALAAIPQLRSLHLMFVAVDGEALGRLVRLPLESLELEWCSGLDATGWQALVSMRNLRHLSFKNWAWSTAKSEPDGPQPWRPEASHVRRLAELPRLRSLELLHCNLDDEQLAALPETLATLRVFGTQITPAGFGGLRRLGGLRELDIDTGPSQQTIADLFAPESVAAAEAVAEALQSLHLQSLRYRGALPPTLAQAVGSQSDLRELAVSSKQPDTGAVVSMLGRLRLQRLAWRGRVTSELLEAVAAQPRLQELELIADHGLSEETLAPLRACRSLRELAIQVSVERGTPGPDQAALQRLFGANVTVRLHRTEFTVKK